MPKICFRYTSAKDMPAALICHAVMRVLRHMSALCAPRDLFFHFILCHATLLIADAFAIAVFAALLAAYFRFIFAAIIYRATLHVIISLSFFDCCFISPLMLLPPFHFILLLFRLFRDFHHAYYFFVSISASSPLFVTLTPFSHRLMPSFEGAAFSRYAMLSLFFSLFLIRYAIFAVIIAGAISLMLIPPLSIFFRLAILPMAPPC